MELTRQILDRLDVQLSDEVVEFAPGVGAESPEFSLRRTHGPCKRQLRPNERLQLALQPFRLGPLFRGGQGFLLSDGPGWTRTTDLTLIRRRTSVNQRP